MNNLKKFNTEADYSAATLNYPAVSWVVSGDIVHFDKESQTPSFSGLTVYYNITDISQPTQLFNGGGGSGSGSGSGSGGALPSAMIIDGTEFYPTPIYQFDTVGEHIVNYSFADNQIPESFLDGMYSSKFSTVTKLEIGNAITTIGDSAFNYCISLTSVTIPDSVTTIGYEAFYNCTSLTSIIIPSGVTSISDSAFAGCTGLTSVTIPDGVTSISSNAFSWCSGLTSINIPSSVTSIGESVFLSCASLTSITVDSNNTVYDSRNNCNGIIHTSTNTLIAGCKNTVIPNSVTSIDNNAFNGCRSLTSINIPSSVTSIGYTAFDSCSSLTSVTVEATTPPTLGRYVFNGTNNCPIYVPSQSVNAYKSASGWSTYSSRIQAIQ